MDILHNIMKITDNKFNTLIFFLENDLKIKYRNYEMPDKLYLNDMIHCIRKDTLDLEFKGRIKKIDDKIHIKHNNYNVYINPDNYYILNKISKDKLNDKRFYEELLKNL